MFRFTLLRGVSAGALTLAVFSSSALAQQSLPTINVGGARVAPSRPGPSRQPVTAVRSAPTTARAATPEPSAPTPAVASPFPSEPKTPAEGYVVRTTPRPAPRPTFRSGRRLFR